MEINNNNNNNQFFDEDDEPTIEIEPLSRKACADFEAANCTAARSDLLSETDTTKRNSAEAEAQVSRANASAIRELQDELKFREEMNSILQFGIDQERAKRRALEEQVSGQQKKADELHDQLGQIRLQLTKTKDKLLKSRDSEKALLSNLKKLGEADSANAAGAEQDRTINQLRKDNLKLTDTVSDLQAKLESATKKADGLETRIGEVQMEKTQRVPVRQIKGRWVLVGLDDLASDTYHLDDGMVSIGSAPDSDVQIQSHFVSRHHAQLVQTDKGSVLADLNSTNGTFINSRRIRKRVLRTGDIVTIGKHRFRYERQSAESILGDPGGIQHSVKSVGS